MSSGPVLQDEIDYADVDIPPEIEPLVRVAVSLWGQDHLRPGLDLSQGTADVFFSCRTKGCPYQRDVETDFGPPHRAVKIALADGLPVAANWSSVTCSGCGKRMKQEEGDPVAVADPGSAEVAGLQDEADRTFYSPEAWLLAKDVMAARAKRAKADEADAKKHPRPTVLTPGEEIAEKVRVASSFDEVKDDIATFLKGLQT